MSLPPDPRADGAAPFPHRVGIDEPDAHGQAALLLAESILHALIEASVLSLDQAVAVVETAAEVKVAVATLAGESTDRMMASLDLLDRIGNSLRTDSL